MHRGEKFFRLDVLWVGLYTLLLFGFAGFSGRPLTMHEARLPQTSREMLAHHEWLLPTSGDRPWLERPPLPHWLVVSVMKIFGHDDRVWIVRLPSAVMGTLTALLTLYIARTCFSPTVGIVAGCLLATSFKFYQYACLAEDDVYLAALVALAAAFFTRGEWAANSGEPLGWWSFFGNRPWRVWGFFTVLGVSNIAKGPLLGILILGSATGVYLCAVSIIQRSAQPLLRYTWLWGWILLIVLTLGWPIWAWHRYPDVLENWKYDYLGRFSGDYTAINQPWWYYPPKLIVGMLPWTPVCVIGLGLAAVIVARAARRRAEVDQDAVDEHAGTPRLRGGPTLEYYTPEKPSSWYTRIQQMIEEETADARGYLWILCWALVPLLVLSIPKGKHDHYLVPFLAPWAILGAIGLVECAKAVHLGRKTFATALAVLCLGYCAGEALFAARTDHTLDDTAFLLRCQREVPGNVALYINGKLGPPGNLDFFRIQFYSRPDAKLLHNLSFLRADSIAQPVVYVIARQIDERLLTQLGTFKRIDQSPRSHDMDTPSGRFTLYRLTFNPQLQRYPVPNRISSLQAMERADGPWCGPPLR
jgi:4-amino-4-deoxy-L-arabinose transferase-like glycosyltransferase